MYSEGPKQWPFHQQVVFQPCLRASLCFLIEVKRKLNPTCANWNYWVQAALAVPREGKNKKKLVVGFKTVAKAFCLRKVCVGYLGDEFVNALQTHASLGK